MFRRLALHAGVTRPLQSMIRTFTSVSNLTSPTSTLTDVIGEFVVMPGEEITPELRNSVTRMYATNNNDWNLSAEQLRPRLQEMLELARNHDFLGSYLQRYRLDNVLIEKLPEDPEEVERIARDALRHLVLYQPNLIRIRRLTHLIGTIQHYFPEAHVYDQIGKYPQILAFDWKNRFRVRRNELAQQFGTVEKVDEALKSQPDLLFVSVAKTAMPRLEMVKDIVGFTQDEVLEFVRMFPRLLSRTIGTVKLRRLLLLRMPHPTQYKAVPHDLVSSLDSASINDKRNFFFRKSQGQFTSEALSNLPYRDYFNKEEQFEAVKELVIMDSRAFALQFPEFTALDKVQNSKEEQEAEEAHERPPIKVVSRNRQHSPVVKEEQFDEDGEVISLQDKPFRRDTARARKDLNDTIHRTQVYGDPIPHEEQILLKEDRHEERDLQKEKDIRKKLNRRDQVQDAWYGNEVYGVKK